MITENRQVVATTFSILILPLIAAVFIFGTLTIMEPKVFSINSQLSPAPDTTINATSPMPKLEYLYQDGVNAYKMARYEQAESRFRNALTLFPNSAILHNKLGMALMEQDRTLEAALAFKKAITINPALVEAHYYLGVIYQDNQRYDEAEQAYRTVIDIDDSFALAHTSLDELVSGTK